MIKKNWNKIKDALTTIIILLRINSIVIFMKIKTWVKFSINRNIFEQNNFRSAWHETFKSHFDSKIIIIPSIPIHMIRVN